MVCGAHRLAAAIRLDWSGIDCFIVDNGDLDYALWEVDENLCRAELTELERAEHLKRRKELYEARHPETKAGIAGALAANAAMGRGDATADSAVASFAADTAEKTGMDARRIRESVRRADKIEPAVKERIATNPVIADRGVELDALASLPANDQTRALGG